MARRAQRSFARRTLDRIRRDGGLSVITGVVMAVLVVLVYVLIVPVGGALIGQTGSPSLWLSVLATALVAIGFEPVRRAVSRALAGALRQDRRTPYQILAGFATSLTGRFPAEQLPGRMAKVLAEGTGAVRAEVWLLVRGELALAAQWPPPVPTGPDAAHGPAESRPEPRHLRHSLDVHERGQLLGRLTVVLAENQELTPVEERLFAGLAAQSSLVLRVAGLRADLRRQLDELDRRSNELRRARRDLVARHDAERQRLERNIHDGAQQQVLALLVNLRLAQTLSARSPERAAAVMANQADAALATIDTLSTLSRGLFPPLLADAGPVGALRAAVASGPIPVQIVADDLPRHPAATEAAVYFGCLEAVQNATKHSQASADLR